MMSGGNETVECRPPNRHLQFFESNLLEALPSHVHKRLQRAGFEGLQRLAYCE